MEMHLPNGPIALFPTLQDTTIPMNGEINVLQVSIIIDIEVMKSNRILHFN